MRRAFRAFFLIFVVSALGSAQPALEAARESLERGRADLALQALEEQHADAASLLRLQAYLDLGEFTQAAQVLHRLETAQKRFVAPADDWLFYLSRGRVKLAEREYDLAEKNFNEALRRAQNAEQKVSVHQTICSMWLTQEDEVKAKAALEKTSELVSQCEAVSLVGEQLRLVAILTRLQGDQGLSVSTLHAARQFFLANKQPARATQILLARDYSQNTLGNHERTLDTLTQVLNEYLAEGNVLATFPVLRLVSNNSFGHAEADARKRIDALFAKVIAAASVGSEKERALLAWSNYQLDTGEQSSVLEKRFAELTGSEEREVRCYAYQGLALVYAARGERSRSLELFEKALETAEPQLRADDDWRTAPGPILLRMTYQEKARMRYKEALELGRRGISLQPGPAWTFWRSEARYETLMTAVEMADREAAAVEFRASLDEVDRLANLDQKVGALTMTLASLLVNQSIEGDVIDPSQALLGEYSELAINLLGTTFTGERGADRYLALFDQWHQQSKVRKQMVFVPFSLIYKGLFLEALGRVREARVVLEAGLEEAIESDLVESEILARVLLARIFMAQEQPDKAVEQMTLASQRSQKINPLAARFYLLAAGGAQRRTGYHSRAIESYSKAIALNPERGWPAYYGRALSRESTGEFAAALEDLKAANELVADSERTQVKAEISAARARILVRLGKPDDALTLYRQAFPELTYSDQLATVVNEFGKLLQEKDGSDEALLVYGRTLDHLRSLGKGGTPEAQALYEQTVSLALREGKHEDALRYLEQSQSIELLQSVDLSRIDVDDAGTKTLLSELQSLRRQLEKLGADSGRAESADARKRIGERLATTRGEFFTKLNQLKEREPDFESLVQVTGSQLSAIQEMLPADSALVEYFPAQNTLYIFLVTRDKFLLHQVSVSRAELTRAVDDLRNACARPSESPDWQKNATRLYEPLIGVVEQELPGIVNLRMVPSGPLWEVPFAALVDEQGQPLSKRYEITYLGSSELLKLANRTRDKDDLGKALLVGGSRELRGVRRELGALSEILPDSQTLSDDELSLSVFRRMIEGRRIVHIASHSVVSPDTSQSYVELGSDRLTLEAIYGLKLEPSSMVVLSSCQSGVGVTVPGKEVTSLATAFSVAGASTVLASRWRVDDATTAEFFEAFYGALVSGASRAQALDAAREKTARHRPHPYYWAAFELIGDPR